MIRKIKLIMAQRLECENIFEEYNDQMQKQGKQD